MVKIGVEHGAGLGTDPKPGLPAPVPAVARSPGRARRLRRAAVVVLAFSTPIAAAAWVAADELAARERQRADTRLIGVLQRARSELHAALADPAADASSLARAAEVRLAVVRGDAAALARLARTFRGLVVEAHGRMLIRPPPGIAQVETAPVSSSDGRVVGSIGIATPLDRRLLRRVHAAVPVPMLFEKDGRVLAGIDAAGNRVVLANDGPATVTVGGTAFRAAAAPVAGTGARLVVLEPAELARGAEDRRIRGVVFAAALVLIALALAVDAASAVVRRRNR